VNANLHNAILTDSSWANADLTGANVYGTGMAIGSD